MIQVKKEGIILEKNNNEFENEGVLNPAAIRVGDCVYLFYRAVRKGNNSTIGFCRLDGPLTLAERFDHPLISPESPNESHGIEDARIVKIDDLYYITYTSYDGLNAQGSLVTSKDLVHFERHGVIVPQITYTEFLKLAAADSRVDERYYKNQKFYDQHADPDSKIMVWDKNVIFFPRRINGQLVFLHRIRPGIQLAKINELTDLTPEYWQQYFTSFDEHVVMDPLLDHEYQYIGGGCPPIETVEGWLIIYHSVHDRIYSACAALLDLNDPTIELARLPYPIFAPEFLWELKGEVNNVVFPTGTAIFGETLFIYYGAADERIACVSMKFADLLHELVEIAKNKKKQ